VSEQPKEIGDFINWEKFQIDPAIQKQIKEFFEDITTLTITTVGPDNEEIVPRSNSKETYTQKPY
jgi:hypothetical protein